jgi:hypothetical protein
MESLFGIGYLAKEILILSLHKTYEKNIQETARIAILVKDATRPQPAWYCPLLLRLGEIMITTGTYLKTHYSTRPSLRTR